MSNILGLSGSPIENSSTDILVGEIMRGAQSTAASGDAGELVRLNELQIMPCQACGRSPDDGYCFFNDSMDDLYDKFDACDAIVIGSPIYFDSVSAQTKLFIDRCNCFRTLNPDGPDHFVPRMTKKRTGAIVLVGGERANYEFARRVIGGFFVWAGVESVGLVTYAYDGFEKGTVRDDAQAMKQAFDLGLKLAK